MSPDEQRRIVTIDGPAGAGKSSVARQLAARLGFEFLDTGGMYRAVALAALRRRVDLHGTDALAALARQIELNQQGSRILLDGEDVSDAIRTLAVTQATRHAADNRGVRAVLVERQRELAGGRAVVSEGRDQGTVVFPESPCKIFLTASSEERARRRLRDLERQGESISLDELLRQQNERDAQDAARPVGPLVKADDAVEVLTDGLSVAEVLERLETLVRERLSLSPP